jgi:hypothetical protein
VHIDLKCYYTSEKYGKPHDLPVQEIEDNRRFSIPISNREYTLKIGIIGPDGVPLKHSQCIEAYIFVQCMTDGGIFHEQRMDKLDRVETQHFQCQIAWSSQRRGLQAVGFRVMLANVPNLVTPPATPNASGEMQNNTPEGSNVGKSLRGMLDKPVR